METRTYITRSAAVYREIIEPIEASGESIDNYNIDAIADAVLCLYGDGYELNVDTDTFWEAVEANEL